MIISLDVASKTGVATLSDYLLTVYFIETASPVKLVNEILQHVQNDTTFLIEDFSYFNTPNPVTTSVLLQRFGYVYWRLIEDGYEVRKCNVNSTRKFLNITGRKKGEQKKEVNKQIRYVTGLKLTTDETDAIAILLATKKLQISDLENFSIRRLKRVLL